MICMKLGLTLCVLAAGAFLLNAQEAKDAAQLAARKGRVPGDDGSAAALGVHSSRTPPSHSRNAGDATQYETCGDSGITAGFYSTVSCSLLAVGRRAVQVTWRPPTANGKRPTTSA